MFMIFIHLTAERTKMRDLMDGHKAWIARGREDGVFLLVGRLAGDAGGAILAHGESREQIEVRVKQDPFVSEGLAQAEIQEFIPVLADKRLQFLAA